jgi:putative SbcD/Mre11-related phosphoesterase
MRFVKDNRAVFLEDLEALVIADLHIGLEYDLYKSGIRIPKQTEKMKEKIKGLIEKTKAKRLIDLGDVKHAVPGTSFQEKKEIPEFFEDLSDMVKIDVVPGNHDGNLAELMPSGVNVHSRSGFREGKYYFSHGHTWPTGDLLKSETLMVAHAHPAIEFEDKFGYRILRPVFLKAGINQEKIKEKYGKRKKIDMVVLPTFNDLFTGTPVKIKSKHNLLGPLFRNNFVDVDECEVYLLDGTFVGKVKDI